MTIKEASEKYADMLFPAAKGGLNWESAKQDFFNGGEWYQRENAIITKTLESIVDVAQSTLQLIKSQTS